MNEKEIENLKNMEKNNTNNMDEKVHYEIKFVETEDGYRLEASGDKKALKRLGISPSMVGRKRWSGRRACELRKVNRRRRMLAAKAKRLERADHPWAAAEFDRPGHPGPDFGPREPMQRGGEFGRHQGRRGPGFRPREYMRSEGGHGRHQGRRGPDFGPREPMHRGGEFGRHQGHQGPGFGPQERNFGEGEHGQRSRHGRPRFEGRMGNETWDW
jgi:hypothetical protein